MHSANPILYAAAILMAHVLIRLDSRADLVLAHVLARGARR